jgi:hypothetical protein
MVMEILPTTKSVKIDQKRLFPNLQCLKKMSIPHAMLKKIHIIPKSFEDDKWIGCFNLYISSN